MSLRTEGQLNRTRGVASTDRYEKGKMDEGGTKVVADRTLLDKIRNLPPEKVAEVEDFVEFLRQREEDRQLTRAATKLSEEAFQKVWDNPDDADYDQL